MVELEDVVPRLDYKLEYIFGCPEPGCGKKCTIYLHRDEYDLQHNRSNIKQKCYDGHISRPYKKCSKCGNNYEIEVDTCINCEKHVRHVAENEVLIENSEKEIKRLVNN